MSDDELEFLAPWNEIVKTEIERCANESNRSYMNCQGALAAEKESGIFLSYLKIKRLSYIQIDSEVVAKEYPDKVMHLRKLQV